MSIGALARRARLSKTSVANIEAGTANPSLETLVSLCEALGVGMSTLLGTETELEPHLVGAGEGPRFRSAAGLGTRLLLGESRNHRTEVMEIHFESGADYQAGPHPAGTAEVIYCIEGRIWVGPAGRTRELGPGDTIWFPADVPHSYRSAGAARAVVVMSYSPATVPGNYAWGEAPQRPVLPMEPEPER